MSYLSLPRMTFSGQFEADVNTVNNDVRNYSVETFQPRFQKPSEPLPDNKKRYNGWWNPSGTNNFRLLNCAASGVVSEDGAAVSDDLALELRVEAQLSRTSAKIVDLDPQFQFASGIWGMRIALMAGDRPLMSGELLPPCFRDIYFGRLLLPNGDPVKASPGASARFTGTLVRLFFDPKAESSPFLRALQLAARHNDDQLSMSLLTYGYVRTPGDSRFTTGRIIGSIAPRRVNEPLSFVAGRRFAPTPLKDNPFAGVSGIGYMDAALDDARKRISVDFGNSLPLMLSSNGPDATIGPKAMGPLRVVVLKEADTLTEAPDGSLHLTAATTNNQTIARTQYEPIGVLDQYDTQWFLTTGGIADFSIPPAAKAIIADHPLAILYNETPSGSVIAIRETIAGLCARADDFIKRVDSVPESWVTSTTSIYAMRYGAPFPNAPLTVALLPPTNEDGGTGPDQVDPPQVPIPLINTPRDAIRYNDAIIADERGVATMRFDARNPGNPRRYLDGQIYVFNYEFKATGASTPPMLEQIAAHVRDAFTPPMQPSWEEDIAPILTQYSYLYPIMSRGLFSLSDYATVAEHPRLLFHAFSLPIEDANYMPATRDLSAGKRRMLLDWLASFLPEARGNYAPPFQTTSDLLASPAPTLASAPICEAVESKGPTPAALDGPGDDKVDAFRAHYRGSARRPM